MPLRVKGMGRVLTLIDCNNDDDEDDIRIMWLSQELMCMCV